MSDHEPELETERFAEDEGRVLSVHVGPSANCSSIGSLVDFLFVSSIVGGAVLSSVAILLRHPVQRPQPHPPPNPGPGAEEEAHAASDDEASDDDMRPPDPRASS